jgi:putative Holliday junction resolvase
MKKDKVKMYLGIDWGLKKIGLAVGDDFTCVAVPFKVVKDLDEVVALIKKEKIDKIVLGEPLTFANKRSQEAALFNEFLAELKKHLKQPVILVDERLTSKLADRLRHEAGNKQAQKNAAEQDAVAAMLILEAYFDLHKA